MGEIRNFKDLIVWQRGMELVVFVYRVTRRFPLDERFGLSSQMRRAAVSIVSNIAEGHSQRHRRVFVNHLDIAIGSCSELETQAEICRREAFATEEGIRPILELLTEVRKMAVAIQNRLTPDPWPLTADR